MKILVPTEKQAGLYSGPSMAQPLRAPAAVLIAPGNRRTRDYDEFGITFVRQIKRPGRRQRRDCTRHIHVPRPSGSGAVQNGCPAVLRTRNYDRFRITFVRQI